MFTALLPYASIIGLTLVGFATYWGILSIGNPSQRYTGPVAHSIEGVTRAVNDAGDYLWSR